MEEEIIKNDKKKYWLKLDKNFLKSSQMKVIRSMPNGKDYIIFYLALMLESIETVGHLRFTSLVPYNDEMLAAVTDTNIDIVRSAVKIFCELGLMKIFDDGTIFLPEVPSITGKESESAERVRNYRKRLREKEDLLTLQCNTEVTKSNDNKEKDKEEDKDKYKEKEIEKDIQIRKEQVPYEKIVELYHLYCPSLPKVMIINNSRKNSIKARFNEYKQDLNIFEVLFSKAEESVFLKGDNKNGWKANFDWLMNSSNMAKVIEDTYKNKKANSGRDYLDEEFNKINKNNLF